ncbi:MAG: hypothetical protein HC884_12440, partial [Chloroflexaceae bacterium]|nr:hypothetical protein [Chloroflexaceae bacterium]
MARCARDDFRTEQRATSNQQPTSEMTMKQVDYNKPNTRARVEARRQMRKARRNHQRSDASQAARFSFRVNRPIPNPALKARTQERPRLALLPRRRSRSARPGEYQGAQVKPGMRRILISWLRTGKTVESAAFPDHHRRSDLYDDIASF